MGRTAIMAVVGGTFAVLGGGKFANGAMAAAFVHMFNAEVKKIINEVVRNPKWKYAGMIKEGRKLLIKAKHLRVELKTFGGGLTTYKALIIKEWDEPSLSGETIIDFYGSQRDTVTYEIEMEDGSIPTWNITIPTILKDFSSNFIGGVGRLRYGYVYAY